MGIRPNGKAVCAVETLAPPTIENAQVQAPMTARLHAAGAGGLERAPRIIEPNVAAGHHLARDVHVIIFEEDQVALEIAVFAEVNNVLNIALSVVIAGMSFAGKDELNRAVLVAGQFDDVFELLEDQGRALIRGEAAGKANGQSVRIEQLVKGDKVSLGQPLALDEKTASSELDQLAAQC